LPFWFCCYCFLPFFRVGTTTAYLDHLPAPLPATAALLLPHCRYLGAVLPFLLLSARISVIYAGTTAAFTWPALEVTATCLSFRLNTCYTPQRRACSRYTAPLLRLHYACSGTGIYLHCYSTAPRAAPRHRLPASPRLFTRFCLLPRTSPHATAPPLAPAHVSWVLPCNIRVCCAPATTAAAAARLQWLPRVLFLPAASATWMRHHACTSLPATSTCACRLLHPRRCAPHRACCTMHLRASFLACAHGFHCCIYLLLSHSRTHTDCLAPRHAATATARLPPSTAHFSLLFWGATWDGDTSC